MGQYRAWKDGKQEFFDGFAFYRVTPELVDRETVQNGAHGSAGWGVARASSNLFALLGLPVRFRGTDANVDTDLPSVILSESLWKREFGANPHVAGWVVRVGPAPCHHCWRSARRAAGTSGQGRRVAVGARLPDRAQWHRVRSGASDSFGQVKNVGRADSHQILLAASQPGRSAGISLGNGTPGPWDIYRFTVLLAFLALPAITSVSLGDLSVSLHRTSWPRRLCRWGFLCAKIALLLSIAFFASLDLAYGFTEFNSNQSVSIQFVSTFLICLFGMRWALSDQRQRCPGLSATRCSPRPRRPALQNISGMERG